MHVQIHDFGCLIQQDNVGNQVLDGLISMLKVLIITGNRDYLPALYMHISFLLVAKANSHPVWNIFVNESEKFNEEYGEISLGNLAQTASPSTATDSTRGHIKQLNQAFVLQAYAADFNNKMQNINRHTHSAGTRVIPLNCSEVIATKEWIKSCIRDMRSGTFKTLPEQDTKKGLNEYKTKKDSMDAMGAHDTEEWSIFSKEDGINLCIKKCKKEIFDVNWTDDEEKSKMSWTDVWTPVPVGYLQDPNLDIEQPPENSEDPASDEDIMDTEAIAEELQKPSEPNTFEDGDTEHEDSVDLTLKSKQRTSSQTSKEATSRSEDRTTGSDSKHTSLASLQLQLTMTHCTPQTESQSSKSAQAEKSMSRSAVREDEDALMDPWILSAGKKFGLLSYGRDQSETREDIKDSPSIAQKTNPREILEAVANSQTQLVNSGFTSSSTSSLAIQPSMPPKRKRGRPKAGKKHENVLKSKPADCEEKVEIGITPNEVHGSTQAFPPVGPEVEQPTRKQPRRKAQPPPGVFEDNEVHDVIHELEEELESDEGTKKKRKSHKKAQGAKEKGQRQPKETDPGKKRKNNDREHEDEQ